MKKFPNDDEGVLTEKRKYYVSKGPLTQVTFKLGLDKYIQLGKGVDNDKDPNEKFYSSLYEAVVAGIYIDGGMKNARDFIHRTLLADENLLPKEEFLATKKEQPVIKDYKSALQEFMQKNKMGVPEYVSISKEGPDNKPVFTEGIIIAGKVVTKGVGNTKKKAQQAGAKVAYEKLLASKKRSETKKQTNNKKQKKLKVKP
jgi:ribonuclease-3